MHKLAIALLFTSVAYGSSITLTWTQNLDLVSIDHADPFPAIVGHPTLIWTFEESNYTGFFFSNPVPNQDFIASGFQIHNPRTNFMPAIYADGNIGVWELTAWVIDVNGLTYTTSPGLGTNEGPCQEPCMQTATGRYRANTLSPLARGTYVPLTQDTIVGISHEPEPATMLLVVSGLVLFVTRKRGGK